MAARASGYRLSKADIPTVLGMAARRDRDHDIAAWFGVNQGRVAEAKDGKWGLPPVAAAHTLPPRGAPGRKGRALREVVHDAINLLGKGAPGDIAGAKTALDAAAKQYDADEP